MSIRKSVVSGMFYEGDFNQLNKHLEECFTSKYGPGSLPVKRSTKEILGIISPHAGYVYSGMCAAWGYKEIAEARMADVYILIGPNHTGMGKNSISLQDWNTPLGLVKTHTVFAQELIEKSGISSDESAHVHEHSLEVQLPFLQYACKDRLEKLKIVAISLRTADNLEKLAEAIDSIAKQRDMRICLIASSDFTHFGPNYGHVPFRYDVKESIYDLDHGAIDKIKKLDEHAFLDYVRKNEMTICGYLPIALLILVLKDKTEKVRLLQYYTSGDLTKDYTNSVSYASLVFE